MISQKVLTRGDAGNASVVAQIDSYYQDKKDDYYSREDQPSQWQGKLAEELNLKGEVSKQDFIMLMQGKHNGVDLRVSKKTKKDNKDRLGIDLTFNAPKSVSLQALVGGDKRLIDAHNQAVKETLIEIEKDADTRIKVNYKSRVENTGKLAIATFRHDTNRNNEPHLHTHSVLINFTKRKDGQYRALHNEKIIKNVKEYTAMYQANMAKRAKELGYNIRHNSNGTFDLAHITKEQLDAFSTRSKEIEAQLEKDKLSRDTATTEQKNAATLMTRKRKDQNIDSNAVKQNWLNQAKSLNIELSPNALNKNTSIDKSIYKNSVNTDFNIGNSVIEKDKKENNLSGIKKLSDIENIKNTNINIQNLNINISNLNENNLSVIKEHNANDRRESNNSTEEIRNSHSNGYTSNELLHRELSMQTELSSDTGRKSQAERTNYMPNLSSINVVQEKGFIDVPLSLNQSEHLGNSRPDHNYRLRWSSDSDSTDGTRSIKNDLNHDSNSGSKKVEESEGENLKEILAYDLPDPDLVDRWKNLAENISFDKGESINQDQGTDEILDIVIDHITDKKVEITAKELRQQLLIKGQGVIDYKSIDELIDQAIKDEKIVYADSKYKVADDRNDNNAISYSDWVDKLVKDDIKLEDAKELVNLTIEKGRLVKTEDIYVTPDHLKSEKNILNAIKFSKKLDLIIEEDNLNNILKDSTLNNGQKNATKLILSSHEQVVGVQGYAGTGKSYMLKTAIDLAEKNNKEVVLLAPYSAQVKSLKDDGLEANTLASFLSSQKKQKEITENSVIVVDESGVVNTKQMEKLVKIAGDAKAKLVLLGDTAQTKAIEAGAPFDLMQKNGMRMAVMDDIQRQKNNELKTAVLNAANSKTDLAVKNLKHVYEIENKEERHNAIADLYANLPAKERANTIVVSGTNADRSDINKKIREKLNVAGQGIPVDQLKVTDHTKAELKLARSYEIGQFVEFNFQQKKLNVTKGNSYEVIGRTNDEIIIKDDAGKDISVKPKNTAMTIYNKSEIEISKGDILRVTKSNKEIDQATGDIYKVMKLNKDSKKAFVECSNGEIKELDLNKKNHLDHAYAMTVHSSQGTTVDKVIVNLDTKSKTTNKEVFYVAISRARHEAHVYTDNLKEMPNAVKQATVKNNATDLVKSKGNSYDDLKSKIRVNKIDEHQKPNYSNLER